MKNRIERRNDWIKIAIVAAASLALLAVRRIFDLSDWMLIAGALLFAAGILVGGFVATRR